VLRQSQTPIVKLLNGKLPMSKAVVSTTISVVIPTHGRPDLLTRTLASLAECELPESYRELIVVENGSRDGAEAVVAAAAEQLNARYLHYEQGNKSAALNHVLELLDDGLIVFFDDDVRLERNVLVAYAEAAANRDAGTFFGGPTEVDYETVPPDWMRTFLPPSAVGRKLPEHTATVREPVFLGFNWAAFAADLRRVGGFDTNFGPGSPSFSTGQEASMQRMLLDAGCEGRYVKDALVWHYVPSSRCTMEWALKRSLQGGISQGQRTPVAGLAVCGWTPKMLQEATIWYLRSVKEKAVRDHNAWFHAKWRLARIRGIAQGTRHARSH
jgi:GT2 family glycosyltransferase